MRLKLLSPPDGFFVESGRRLPYLDVLRTLAITLVMVRHFVDYTPEYLELAQQNGWQLWRFGVTGVDLFFVLSGFLIFSMLFRLQRSNSLSVKDYFVGRILRIWPAYFASILVVAIFSSFESLTHIVAYLLFLQNYVLVSPNVNGGIYWTLAVEEHFYLFAPLLVVLLAGRNHRRNFACLATLLFLPILLRFASVSLEGVDVELLTEQTHYRIDTITCGVFVAYLFHNFPGLFTRKALRLGALCLGLVAGPVAVIGTTSWVDDPTWGAVHAVVGISVPGYFYAAVLCFALAFHGTSVPGARFWRTIAHLSYSMYLYHIFGVVIAGAVFSHVGIGGEFLIPHFVFFFVVTVILATISYILVERPFLRLREIYRHSPGRVRFASQASTD